MKEEILDLEGSEKEKFRGASVRMRGLQGRRVEGGLLGS